MRTAASSTVGAVPPSERGSHQVSSGLRGAPAYEDRASSSSTSPAAPSTMAVSSHVPADRATEGELSIKRAT